MTVRIDGGRKYCENIGLPTEQGLIRVVGVAYLQFHRLFVHKVFAEQYRKRPQSVGKEHIYYTEFPMQNDEQIAEIDDGIFAEICLTAPLFGSPEEGWHAGFHKDEARSTAGGIPIEYVEIPNSKGKSQQWAMETARTMKI